MYFERLWLCAILTIAADSTAIGFSTTESTAPSSRRGFTAMASTVAGDENSDNLSAWNDLWKERSIDFHQSNVHHTLLKWGNKVIPQFSVPGKKDNDSAATCSGESVRVFVPLSGKTVDMAFLAEEAGVSEVVGLEGIRQALDEFAEENPSLAIKPVEDSSGSFDVLKGKKVTLLKGDYFDLDETSSGGLVDVVWDRGSLVAIEPDKRESYVAILTRIVAPGGVVLSSSLERREGPPEALVAGPPYSIVEAEVQRLFQTQDWKISKMEEIDAFLRNPGAKEHFEQVGITSLFEVVYLIKRN